MLDGVCVVTEPNEVEPVPVDNERTNRSHVGEAITDGRNYPGYLLVGLGLATLGLTLVAAGYGFRGWAVTAGIVCVISFIVGALAILMEHRRVKRLEGRELLDQKGH